jgi:hypothetical protein
MRTGKIIASLLFLLVTSSGASAQKFQWGLDAEFGASRLKLPSYLITTKILPSGTAGVFARIKINHHFFLGGQLMAEELNYGYHYSLNYGQAWPSALYFDAWTHMHSINLASPVYVGLSTGKWSLAIGARPSFVIYSYGREVAKMTDYDERTSRSVYTWHPIPFHKFQYGPQVSVGYNINKGFSLALTYYYGFNNILDISLPHWTWRPMQLTAGIQYKLGKS